MIALGGWPDRIVLGSGRFGVVPAEFNPLGVFDGPLENDPGPGDAATEFAWVITSLPVSGMVAANDDGGFSHTGAADGSYTTVYQLWAWPVGGPLSDRGPGNIFTSFGSSIGLIGANCAQAAISAVGIITQAHALAAAGTWQAASAAAGAVTQSHQLAGAAAGQAAGAGAGAVTQLHTLQGAAASQAAASSANAIGLGVAITLSAANCSQATSAGTGAVQEVHVLIAAPSVQDAMAGASAIVQAHMLAAATATQRAACNSGAILLGVLSFRPPWLFIETTLPPQTVITTTLPVRTITTTWN